MISILSVEVMETYWQDMVTWRKWPVFYRVQFQVIISFRVLATEKFEFKFGLGSI